MYIVAPQFLSTLLCALIFHMYPDQDTGSKHNRSLIIAKGQGANTVNPFGVALRVGSAFSLYAAYLCGRVSDTVYKRRT